VSTKTSTAFLRRLVAVTRRAQVPFLAAAVAYYAFVSFLPLILLSISVAALVGGEAFSERVTGLFSESLTPEAVTLTRSALTMDAAAGGVTVAGLVALTWSGLRLFRGLDTAFSAVYGTMMQESFLNKLVDGLVVLVSIGVGVTTTVIASAGVRGVAGSAVPGLAVILSLATLVVALLPLYYFFPDREISLAGALPGTVLAALGWSALGGAFRLYASVAASSVYGVLGAAMLVVTWLYFGAVIVMLGAALNATLAGEDRQLQHPGTRQTLPTAMDEVDEDPTERDPRDDDRPTGDRPDPERDGVRTELDQLWEQLEGVEARLEEKTVDRSEFEAEMKGYVRKRQRRGHARGWGPYLVLLYGTGMTLGAFYYLDGGWAVLAMIVIWLSTLGLYALMVIFGMVVGGLSAVGRLRDVLGSLRS